MRGCLASAAAAAITFIAAPAQAERWTDPGYTSPANVTVHRGSAGGFRAGPSYSGEHRRHDGDRGGHRRDRHRGDAIFVGGWGGGYWAEANNRSWDAESYNDWWHERPWRAYPRWVRSNADCERLWQGGGVWRCEW